MYFLKKKRGICVDYNNSRLGDPQKLSFPRSPHMEQLESQGIPMVESHLRFNEKCRIPAP